MSIYPDVITGVPATLPIEFASSQAILNTEFENGVESRRLIWESVRRDVRINYSVMTFSDANILRRFYEAREGPFKSFAFFCPQVEYYNREYAGTSTVSSETFLKMPSKGAQSYTLYRNSFVLHPSMYVFTPESGPDGEDMVELATGPAGVGDSWHFTFTGRLKIRARFSNSPLVFRDIKNIVSSTVVELKALEPLV